MDVFARLWARVSKTPGQGPNGDCWEWQGANRIACGYGRLKRNGRHVLAHRLAWEYANGRAPAKDILHSCDNPPCCNPAHLREGSHTENMHDAIYRKGRNSDFTKEELAEVRFLLKQGFSNAVIAKEFKVAAGTISRIKTGACWSC